MALTATLDKATYAPGEKMTLTVTSDARKKAANIHVDVEGVGEADVTATIVARVVVTDTARTWTVVSDNGTVAKYEAIA
jgi:hypothetical protein